MSDLEVMPALFNHASNTYKAMFDEAQEVEIEGLQIIVYEGKLTELVTKKLYLSVPYYTSVTSALKNMGCIKQLRRGGGSSMSQWELRHEPTRELFTSKVTGGKTSNRSKQGKVNPDEFEQLTQRVRDLGVQIEGVQAKLKVIIAAMPDDA